ncbi:MAG: DUF1559 domain-containing protein [Lentisphaerae bacterium]|nr:MAG: DUF1559 domain-containing protein [Lentisphaerota bacterium]
MLPCEIQMESRVRENFTHGLVGEVKPKRCRRQIRGFTLIELLVVLTIITILASLLLPALSHARRKAMTIACINNIHQLGLACNGYAEDYGVLPPGHTPGWKSDWPRLMSEWLQGRPGPPYSKILQCPGAVIPQSFSHFNALFKLFPNFASYPAGQVDRCGTLRELGDRGDSLVILFDGTQRIPDGYVHPLAWAATDWYFYEDRNDNDEIEPLGPNREDASNLFHIRWRHPQGHQPAANFLFADFHVENVRWGTLTKGHFRVNRNGRKNFWE